MAIQCIKPTLEISVIQPNIDPKSYGEIHRFGKNKYIKDQAFITQLFDVNVN